MDFALYLKRNIYYVAPGILESIIDKGQTYKGNAVFVHECAKGRGLAEAVVVLLT